jgi:tRNA pseudouridine13 synthase
VKVKQTPADFQVEERAAIEATDRGRFSVYRLRKTGIGTLEALRAIRRAWRVPGRAVGFGGLKDRHGTTTQWVTIPGGPRRNLEEPAFRLTYEGRSPVPMTRMALRGNAFRVRVRDLSPEEATTLARRLGESVRDGVVAYFDDQRFGSLRGGGGYAVLHLLRGDAEAALKAVIASPDRADRAAARDRKRTLRERWGDWQGMARALGPGVRTRDVVLRLAKDPKDFLGAFAALDREERGLLVSAYQSGVWNRAVSRHVSRQVPDDARIVLPGAACPLVFPKSALPSLEGATLPLPARNARASDPALQEALEESLAEDGLRLDGLRLPESMGLDFRATARPVLFRPEDASASPPLEDGENPGRHAVDLSFHLRPGVYATILLKRMTYDFTGRRSRRSRR